MTKSKWQDMERRRHMTDDELFDDVMAELRERMVLRDKMYASELAKRNPRISFLIQQWTDQWNDLEMGFLLSGIAQAQQAFADEMEICEYMIAQLSEPEPYEDVIK